MSIQKRKRELLKTARLVSPKATIEMTRGTHLQLNIIGPKGICKIFCCLTPSDHRDSKNIKREIAQAGRQVGLLPERN